MPSLGINIRHHSASLLKPISDPRDIFFYPHNRPMKDTYSPLIFFSSHPILYPFPSICIIFISLSLSGYRRFPFNTFAQSIVFQKTSASFLRLCSRLTHIRLPISVQLSSGARARMSGARAGERWRQTTEK